MKTALYDQHVALGAKIVSFAGWEMPIHYTGIVPEHHAVRQAAGLFDVSHMGRILVEGPQAAELLDFLSTNQIVGRPVGTATYTVWCNAQGGSVDDVMIYKADDQHFFVVVNAGNRQKDLQHLLQYAAGKDVVITDRFQEEGILALQGPLAKTMLEKVFPAIGTLAPMHFLSDTYDGQPVILSATGYTGAGGFEIYAPHSAIVALWRELLHANADLGLVPVGLGARDTLRLEMGYALYGHELSEEILPSESVSHWTVKSAKHEFSGKELQSRKQRSQYGLVMLDKDIAREGFEVYKDDAAIGMITSGTFSPTLQKAIAIVMSSTPLVEGDLVQVKIRHNFCSAQVVKLPFLAKPKEHT